MYQYFKTFHAVADTDKREFNSIKDLTIAVAKSGGYRRELVTQKNGKQVMKTKYNVPATWDDALVAKWFCHFERLFMSKLGAHPEISEFYGEIIQKTFTIYFNALQIDKIEKDTNVNTVVYLCLSNRMNETLVLMGSEERLARNNSYTNHSQVKKFRDRVNLKSAFNYMMGSLDELENADKCGVMGSTDTMPSDLLIDISAKLKNNKLGLRLLEAMVYSDNKVNISKIRDYVNLGEGELTKETASQLEDAYETIVGTVMGYYPEYDYDSAFDKKVKLDKISKRVAAKELEMGF